MVRYIILTLILSIIAATTFAHAPDSLLLRLSTTGQDTNRINLLLQIGRYHLDKPGRLKINLDSSRFYVQAAIALSKHIYAVDHQYRALALQGQISVQLKNFRDAEKHFKEVTDYYHRQNNLAREAYYWEQFGNEILDFDMEHASMRRLCYERSYQLYKTIGYKLKTSQAMGKMADVDLNTGNYYQAEKIFLRLIEESKQLKDPQIYHNYFMLGETYFRTNQLQKALIARINCVRTYEKDPDKSLEEGFLYYQYLAMSYSSNNHHDKALLYSLKSFDILVKIKDWESYYSVLGWVINGYVKVRNYKAGLLFLDRAIKLHKPVNADDRLMAISSRLRLYNLMGKDEKMESTIPAFNRALQEVYTTLGENQGFYNYNNYISQYESLIQYYIRKNRWGLVAEILEEIEPLTLKTNVVSTRLMVYECKYKLDSANKNYLAAITGLQKIKIISDSLANTENRKQVNELEARYQAENREKQIQSLNKQTIIQNIKLDSVNQQRNFTLFGILILSLLAGIIFYAYRLKQKSNHRLQLQQKKINIQNNTLSNLLTEKEKILMDKDHLLDLQKDLIFEKEWLLREIHHRVKNNLQVVMSLLYTQAAYIQNPAALDAIKDSQNRVQAIAIIHQKLYSKANVAIIVLEDYVTELVSYLSSCYNPGFKKIKIRTNILNLNLDISQAVPIGLILNEAITNSIKYAFDDDGGEIKIEACMSGIDSVQLRISDNGRGLPENFNVAESSSMGMEIMLALGKQLGGTFSIKNEAGTLITLLFRLEKVHIMSDTIQ